MIYLDTCDAIAILYVRMHTGTKRGCAMTGHLDEEDTLENRGKLCMKMIGTNRTEPKDRQWIKKCDARESGSR